ncbi:MAG: class I SAM-dependent methyltransferase [Acidobacteriaceae bacterium]
MSAHNDASSNMASQTAIAQPWNPSEYSAHGRFVTDLGANILEWLDPKPGEEVLDLGCGDGMLTEQIAQRGAHVLGVDASPEMIDAARNRGVPVELMDATRMDFPRRFDAVFSNAALHWIHDQPALLRGVARALKPGGRFVAEMGGHGNIAAIRVALHAALTHHGLADYMAGNNYFPTVAEYRSLLQTHGFAVNAMDLVPRPTPLPSGMRAWLMMFRRGVFNAVPEDLRETILKETLEHLEPALRGRDGNWIADYVRLRFRACIGSADAA